MRWCGVVWYDRAGWVCQYLVCRSRPRLRLTCDGTLSSFSRYFTACSGLLSRSLYFRQERDQNFLSSAYSLHIILIIYFGFTFSPCNNVCITPPSTSPHFTKLNHQQKWSLNRSGSGQILTYMLKSCEPGLHLNPSTAAGSLLSDYYKHWEFIINIYLLIFNLYIL